MRAPLIWSFAIVSALLAGCSAFNQITADQRRQELPAAVGKFNKALSWNAFDEAIGSVDPASAPAFMQDMKRFMGKGSITEVNLAGHDLDSEAETAAVTTEIKYFVKPSYVIKTINYSQNWEYKMLNGGWTMVSASFVEPEGDGTAAALPGSPQPPTRP